MENQFHMFHCFLAAIFAFFAATSAASVCKRTCNSTTVQFPFGFSETCNIRLKCSIASNSIYIGEFSVRNITSESILLHVPIKCNRSVTSLKSLFSKNFAPTQKNSLFFSNCTGFLNNSSACHEGNFMLQYRGCSSNNSSNVTENFAACFSNQSVGFYSNDSFRDIGCSVLISSGSVENPELNSVNIENMELGWWMNKPCQCSNNAEILQVEGKGCICKCFDGFEGDGYTQGDGCRKVSAKCSASKFLLGDCGGGTSRLIVLVGGILVGAIIMALVALVWWLIRREALFKKRRMSMRHLLSQNSCTVPLYTYKDIERATNSFSGSQLLGTGAFGTVYAGKLSNNELVAIKRIKKHDNDSIEQVMNEIKLLCSVSHPNLVKLLGCCIEGDEQILVYEYMPNGTLAQHLQRERGPAALPWTVRLAIAAETARAIAYLHSAIHPPIFHRDIKSSNILLDYSYNSKVADFGLSRNGITDSSHVSTAPQGTPGYVDPQYHQNFHLSDKSDVYSFGVVLIEIITAQKAIDFNRVQTEVNLASLAINRIGKGKVDEIIDPILDPHRDTWTISSIHKVAELAFRCLAYQREIRPSMIEVADDLEQIQLSMWTPAVTDDNVFMSTASSFCSSPSPSEVTEKSWRTSSKSRRLAVLSRLEEMDVESPVSVQDPWLSEQSSPSANSLLGNTAR